ncbi:hypothetical protein M8J77_010983 [Diaphorina citri]|nr:hypothetical protein M8J77_010983 [Diaphorina citri]
MFLRDSTASTGQETANLFAESFSSAYKKSDLSIPVYPLQDVIDFGVGQGSHIGPLLFSLFFNDLPDVICHSSVLMFADDVKLYKSITCPEDYLLLQRDLDRFSEWLSLNGMELSLHKCFVMEFSRSKALINQARNRDELQEIFPVGGPYERDKPAGTEYTH